ncbi:MAG: glycosyltransferase family 9 protein [Candidatus Gastranaerophilaceae bacterium]|jgi:ADP-heptose:LPS heptosyltransferase
MNIENKETVDIILPSRIGDCIMAMPAILCLKQLTNKFKDKKFDIRIFSTNGLTEIIKTLDLFPVHQYKLSSKLKSFIRPSNRAIFLHATTNNIGFLAKKTYGINIKSKKIKYDYNMPYLNIFQSKQYLPEKLFSYFIEKYDFSTLTISFLGLCLEFGFSVDEIIETFDFNENSFNLKNSFFDKKQDFQEKKYFVFCMEAAYGSKNDVDRRWDENNFFNIAKRIYDDYGIESAFIGINTTIKLPKGNYVYDLRKKLTLSDTCRLLKYSKGYIGNDTGPLHLANFMKKYSIGIYFRESSLRDYTPIYKSLNKPIFAPNGTESVLEKIKQVIELV